MKHSYLVVDQNYLRSEALRELLSARPEVRLVLPDVAMLEMTKPDQRELTVRESLAIISEDPGRVFVSRALSECLAFELNTRRPVVGHMIDQRATKFVRRLLEAVASGSPNAEYHDVIVDPQQHLTGLKRDYLSHDTNKARSLELVAETKKKMSTEFARRVRGARATTQEKLDFVIEKAPSLLVGVLEDNGFAKRDAIRLYRRKPMLLRYFFAKLWYCLSWEEQGRLEGLGPMKVSNDLLDQEYVLAATFFDGVLSGEQAVHEACAAVNALLARA